LNYFHLVILSLVQGLTEFLPVSSSAHLILLPRIAGWQDQGLVYDIAAHLGSVIAVIVFFRKELAQILSAWIDVLQGKIIRDEARLGWYIILATIPVLITGYLLYDIVAVGFRNPNIIAVTTILFGLLLWWADIAGKRIRNQECFQIKDAILIGLAQVLALVPGTSRSGITITAGLMLGFNRNSAARFSFYLAIPVILISGFHEIYRYFEKVADIDPAAFFMVTAISGMSAWLAIRFFLAFIERIGMLPFVLYRLCLGMALIYWYM
jgi:undecaprenyl-diphosphatase